jgi:hypothetical protein
MNIFHFRCLNGDIITVEAADERAARSWAMERRWGPPQLNQTWACAEWQGLGLRLVDEQGMPILEAM